MLPQLTTKSKIIVTIILGTALTLHFGTHFIKPLLIPTKTEEDVNAQVRKKTEEGLRN